MKYISVVLLAFILNCQHKTSTDIKRQNDTPQPTSNIGRDTIQSIKNSQISESNELDPIRQKLSEQTRLNSIEADSDFQLEANEKLTKLLKHYGENMPDYFGGGFIDEKGNLVINIKGKLENGRTKVIKIIGSDNILFQSIKYSNKELIAIMDYLNEFAQKPENKIHINNISAWSQMESYIEVCFKIMNKNSEADFKKFILDSKAIHFKECGEIRLE